MSPVLLSTTVLISTPSLGEIAWNQGDVIFWFENGFFTFTFQVTFFVNPSSTGLLDDKLILDGV